MNTSRSSAAGLGLGLILLTLATRPSTCTPGLPIPQLSPFRGAVKWVLLGYTALTIVLFFVMPATSRV